MRADEFAQAHRIQIGGGKAHDFGPEQEMAVMLGDIAELHQRVQAAPRRRRRKVRHLRHLAQRHLRIVLAEGAQHRQPAFERREIFGIGMRFLSSESISMTGGAAARTGSEAARAFVHETGFAQGLTFSEIEETAK